MSCLITISKRLFCDLSIKNKTFLKKIRRNEQELYIHQKARKIDQKKLGQFVSKTSREKIAFEMAKKTDYDHQLKDFITKFNVKHKNKITLLDFSKYVTSLGELKDKPLQKQDIEIVRQFQKRKVDQRITEMKDNVLKKNKGNKPYITPHSIERQFIDLQRTNSSLDQFLGNPQQGHNDSYKPLQEENQEINNQQYHQGPFKIKDSFMIMMLGIRTNTKVTTLNRINSYKTLLFMGNGNGIISYAKGQGVDPNSSLVNALTILKKNIIAIPRDSRITLPLAIKKKFQDYRIYLRPVPGFNAHGHPLIAFMLTLAGIDHCGFHVSHTQKNIYNVLKVFYKAITTNTTPQQLAERQGFKVYRHQFIRPLTHVRTHGPLAGKAKVRRFKTYPITKQRSLGF